MIPNNGFYEWRKEAEGKQPYRFQMKIKPVYAFAGCA
ncbi:SOS response-associated peptidase family protein [Paenibacillus sinopodophylli]|nr:SOS response-associated peptidase family protein [Paenibacillus sinopodophylli]